MSDPKMPESLERQLLAEIQRHAEWICKIVERWPNYRREIAAELLGAAIGTADTFGCDAQTVLDDIRRECGKADELHPPRSS